MPRLYVYDNWSAYDELSDNVPLTEELAMRELAEIVRLRRHGVKMDAYLMDAFWYERSGGYREWKKDRWPNGPDRWIRACQENGLLPGLWFPANTAFQIDVPAQWQDSLDANGWGFCCFEGGFMAGFVDVLSYWYERGIRIFKFDFAEFGAIPSTRQASSSRHLENAEVRTRNIAAYRQSLGGFKENHPDAILCAYNGFEEAEYMTWTDRPCKPVLDPEWLKVFDSIYSGDPRPADLPLPDFWRTLDVYADHMVWYLNEGGIPLERIDNCSFMIGETGTGYRRGKAGWKACLLLSLARGGDIHMTLGNLENLTNADAEWFAAAQRLFEPREPRSRIGRKGASQTAVPEPLRPNPPPDSATLHCPSAGSKDLRKGGPTGARTDELSAPAAPVRLRGGPPGMGAAYAWECEDVTIAVNPSLQVQAMLVGEGLWLLYSDGYVRHEAEHVILGPGAVVLFSSEGKTALGSANEGIMLERFEPVFADWRTAATEATVTFAMPADGDLHLVFCQFDAEGLAVRTTGGSPPDGQRLPELLRISATVDGVEAAIHRPDDRAIWSGLSWAYGVIPCKAGQKLEVRMETSDQRVTSLRPAAFVATT